MAPDDDDDDDEVPVRWRDEAMVGLVNAARVTEVDTITSSSLIKLDDRQRIRDESERSRSV